MAKITSLPPEIIHRIVDHLINQSCSDLSAQARTDLCRPPVSGPQAAHAAVPVGPELFAASLLQSALGFFQNVTPNGPANNHHHSNLHLASSPPTDQDNSVTNNGSPSTSPASPTLIPSSSGTPVAPPKSPFGFDYSKIPSRSAPEIAPSAGPSGPVSPLNPATPSPGPPNASNPSNRPTNFHHICPHVLATHPRGHPRLSVSYFTHRLQALFATKDLAVQCPLPFTFNRS